MMARCFLLIAVLFHFSSLSYGREKLVILPEANIPEQVKEAAEKAIFIINNGPGFFVNEKTVAAPIVPGREPHFGSHPITALREVTEKEVEMARRFKKGDIVSTYAGEATVVKVRENWSIFKLNVEENEVSAAKPSKFLKFSEYQKGDEVFILSNYRYDHLNTGVHITKKNQLIMKLANPDIIKNQVTYIDLKKSSQLNTLGIEFNKSIAVNQKGEVIGALTLMDDWGPRMITIGSDLIKGLSEEMQNSLEQEETSHRRSVLRPLQTESVQSRDTNKSPLKKCFLKIKNFFLPAESS